MDEEEAGNEERMPSSDDKEGRRHSGVTSELADGMFCAGVCQRVPGAVGVGRAVDRQVLSPAPPPPNPSPGGHISYWGALGGGHCPLRRHPPAPRAPPPATARRVRRPSPLPQRCEPGSRPADAARHGRDPPGGAYVTCTRVRPHTRPRRRRPSRSCRDTAARIGRARALGAVAPPPPPDGLRGIQPAAGGGGGACSRALTCAAAVAAVAAAAAANGVPTRGPVGGGRVGVHPDCHAAPAGRHVGGGVGGVRRAAHAGGAALVSIDADQSGRRRWSAVAAGGRAGGVTATGGTDGRRRVAGGQGKGGGCRSGCRWQPAPLALTPPPPPCPV